MIDEKLEAHMALLVAWQAGTLGEGALALSEATLRHYLPYVRANRRRLAKAMLRREPAKRAKRTNPRRRSL